MTTILLIGSCELKNEEYFNPKVLATHSAGEEFVGSLTCMECHKEVYDSHMLTAHYNTSSASNSENIKGSFESGSNKISLPDFDLEMVEKGNSNYQVVSTKNGDGKRAVKKIDIVIGSGVKGQSFLTWEDEKLYQIQTSYYPPTDSWINSPGFPDHIIHRPIRDGCLKCHVTHATNLDFSGSGNRYNPEEMIFGVDCEKCHRPAEKHVVFHRANPDVETSRYMLKLDTLSRDLRLDVCAQCHSGPRDAILKGNSFSFLAGERLDEYSRNYYTGIQDNELDVHGNQYGLLKSSKCYLSSPQMDCSTCHNPHMNQRGEKELFNQKCISCHNNTSVDCSAELSKLNAMGNNCISCHMPSVESKTMSVMLAGEEKQAGVMIRTHLIGIYPEEKDSLEMQMDTSTVNNIKTFIGSL